MKFKLLFVGVLSLATLSGAQSVFAWHPVGVISKQVQNVSVQGGQMPLVDADTDEQAVEVKTGDLVRYSITVRNEATPSSNNYNDLAFIEVIDEIPAGLELVSDPTKRQITYTVETLAPGEEDTKTFDMEVLSTVNKQIVVNEACFTGDSVIKDKPQSGCDQARVKLNIPQTSSTTTTKPTPTTQAAVSLPKTGMPNVFVAGLSTGMAGYTISLALQKRRNITK